MCGKKWTILSLGLACLFLWSGAFVLKSRRHRDVLAQFDRPVFLMIQPYVGQGESLVLVSPDRKVTLIDGGPAIHGRPQPWNAYSCVIAPLLRSLGLSGIDQVIVTHHDEDHIGSLLPILEKMKSVRVFDNGRIQLTRTFAACMDILRRGRLDVSTLSRGECFLLGRDVRAEVLWPERARGIELDHNDSAVVLRVVHGVNSVLLTGDITQKAEREIILRYGEALACDYLKVPHHGSKSSSSFAWIRMSRPKMAGISAGRRNKFAHPSHCVLERYRTQGRSRVFSTRRDGDIVLVSDGRECYLLTQSGRIERLEPRSLCRTKSWGGSLR